MWKIFRFKMFLFWWNLLVQAWTFGFSESQEESKQHVREEHEGIKSIKNLKNNLKTKVRRGKRKSFKVSKKPVRFLGVNCAGLKSKMTSFKKVLNELKPAVFFLEETKYEASGRLKIGNSYHIYELIRQDKKEGA